MKKVFRKIQKGTTKMIERIKSLGEMETKQKCVVQRFEIIIPLHQKITTQYIASASFTCGFFSYRRLDLAEWRLPSAQNPGYVFFRH